MNNFDAVYSAAAPAVDVDVSTFATACIKFVTFENELVKILRNLWVENIIRAMKMAKLFIQKIKQQPIQRKRIN